MKRLKPKGANMFPLVTAEESRTIDRLAEEMGISSLILMENASLRLIEVITQHFELDPPKSVVIVAGKGNNGGDGMAVARHLHNIGFQAKVFLVASPNELKGDALTNYQAAINFGVSVEPISSTDRLSQQLKDADLVVDALLGTGVSGEVHGIYADVVQVINNCAKRTLSVDIPSGINADTGEICGIAVRADATVTLGSIKLGLASFPAAEYAGDLFVGSLGIPNILDFPSNRLDIHRFLVTDDLISKTLLPRHPNTHKGDYGRVLIIGGSPGMTGAVIMAGKSALRCGAGLAQIALPKSLNIIAEATALEVMSFSLPETEEGTISPEALNTLAPRLEWADVIAIGCGISRHEQTQSFVRQLIAQVDKPIVVDADGLIALVGQAKLVRHRKSLTVLTPHPGEMAMLLRTTPDAVQRNRIGFAQQVAKEFNAVVVLKGNRTVTSDPDGTSLVNPTGNAGMATGGSGDVLTGMIAALIAQRNNPSPPIYKVACAVFLHGLAGDIAVWEKGETALVAGDLLEYLPRAINEPELARPLTLRPLSPFVQFPVRMKKYAVSGI